MANLGSLTPFTTSATALSNLVLVSPQSTIGYQPQNPNDQTGQTTQQPPALLFHYEGEQTVKVKSDITDHWVEDNTAIQDQIAQRPVMITTHGFIGELNDIPPLAIGTIQEILNKLTVISSYTPQLTETALIAYDTAFQLYQTAQNAVNAAVSTWGTVNSQNGENVIGSNGFNQGVFDPETGQITGNQNKQQLAFQQFYGYWTNRYLFTVQTPWAIFTNMAIDELTAVQSEETRMITDFQVTFKQMRFANTLTLLGQQSITQGRLSFQSQAETSLGNGTPNPSNSMASGLHNFYPTQFPGVP